MGPPPSGSGPPTPAGCDGTPSGFRKRGSSSTSRWSPDDRWSVGGSAPIPFAGDSGIDAYEAWRAGSRAIVGNGLLSVLPDGRYLVVRIRRPPVPRRQVSWANELGPAPDEVWELIDDGPAQGLVIGVVLGAAPAFDRPLLGVIVPPQRGIGHVWALSFGPVSSADPGPERDSVLILPVTGPLVLPGSDPATPWTEAWASALAGWLAGWLDDELRWPERRRRAMSEPR